MSYQKGFISIIVLAGIVVVAIIFSFTAGYFANKQIAPWTPISHYVACTQEAKLCPDGSYVSRTEQNCEFAKCPEVNPNPTPTPSPAPTPIPNGKQISLQEGQKEGSLLVQKIYSDYVTGLNFPEYPLATTQGFPITLHIGETASNGCTITLTLISIQGNTATFTKKTYANKICPICLAKNTLIDTPNGQIPVQNLQKGMSIWSQDKFGNRISLVIIKTSKTPVPSTHQMVHIILDDKREIFASPGHPIGDGRVFNDLSVGDILNGSRIVVAEKTSYNKGYTYDILPSGDTGFYFANGILVDSTLH